MPMPVAFMEEEDQSDAGGPDRMQKDVRHVRQDVRRHYCRQDY